MYATVPTAVPGLVRSASAAIVGNAEELGTNTHMLGSEFSQAEIEHFGLAAARHKNIGWLDIAMNDAFCMGGIERVGNLDSEVEYLVERKRLLADAMLQRLPFEQLHGDEWDLLAAVIHHIDFVDRADVRVIQRRGGAGFALKSFERRAIFRESFGQELQRHLAAQLGVFGLVDHTHAAAAELFQDHVVRKGFPDHFPQMRSVKCARC